MIPATFGSGIEDIKRSFPLSLPVPQGQSLNVTVLIMAMQEMGTFKVLTTLRSTWETIEVHNQRPYPSPTKTICVLTRFSGQSNQYTLNSEANWPADGRAEIWHDPGSSWEQSSAPEL